MPDSGPSLPRWRLAVSASAVLVAASALSGCVPGPSSRAPEGDPIAAARALPNAGGVIKDGARSCGEFVLEQGEDVPEEARDCLVAASVAGEPAELAWSTPTSEGDPIVSFATVGLGRGIQVYTTDAFDRHSRIEDPTSPGAGWSGYACDDPADLFGTGDCDPLVEG
ncbi:hypothetical protein SAMN06295885_3644 [Rathayibacter oskolensis]|uniref:Lipoprotein n=1 Tax=Rathayibacter oskolensis TaxID=1891671 RepID=A0A1X7PIV9_9MICO|nr:hypothetical protein [Rathayibacter oskolensis]SMH50984.1 hypothetical protein SAMN06295885_3644 [Rathayibacter oskolensis]